MAEDKKTITVFGYPLRDYVILIALLGSTATGGALIGGTPSQTTNAIETQTDILSDIREDVRANRRLYERLTFRVDAMDDVQRRQGAKVDSLYQTLMDGLDNLDGYFRGRLDQLRPSPSK